jgi:hypothetical protein
MGGGEAATSPPTYTTFIEMEARVYWERNGLVNMRYRMETEDNMNM